MDQHLPKKQTHQEVHNRLPAHNEILPASSCLHRHGGNNQNKILEDGSADFLLDDENSYQYKFDKEEEVSEEKMQRLFGLRDQRMKVL